MDLYIVNKVCSEFDCGGSWAEIVGVAKTYEEALKLFNNEQETLKSDDWGYKIKNDYQYQWTGNVVYRISYQNYCSNLAMQIEKLTL